MTRTSNLETWIHIAKLGMAAGEMAPFPYIKGLCGCAVLVLEAIEVSDKLPLYIASSLIRDCRELARIMRTYWIWQTVYRRQ